MDDYIFPAGNNGITIVAALFKRSEKAQFASDPGVKE